MEGLLVKKELKKEVKSKQEEKGSKLEVKRKQGSKQEVKKEVNRKPTLINFQDIELETKLLFRTKYMLSNTSSYIM